MSTSTSSTCSICCDAFNKSIRASIVCPACKLNACRKCIRTYLLGSSELPHCMGCKNQWGRDFLIRATLKSFVNKEYHQHRANLLLEQEKSRIPETMPAVENYLKIDEEKKELALKRKQIIELREKLWVCKHAEETHRDNIRKYTYGEIPKNVKRTFKRACPVNDCRGFLSTQWKCGVCNIWVCPTCMEAKGEQKNAPHECNPDTVATAALLKKETKNCPSCAAMIYKISGCDQMWCTQCHIAFSWKTGRRVNGVVHNPHFYQWQNGGGGAANVNVPGAVMCGGLPALHLLNGMLRRLGFQGVPGGYHGWNMGDTQTDILSIFDDPLSGANMKKISIFIIRLHQNFQHFSRVNLRYIRNRCQAVTDNRDLRIKYVVKEITEKKLKSDIARRDKIKEKRTAILHIYELLNTVFTESFRDIYETGQTILKQGVRRAKVHLRARVREMVCAIKQNYERCNKVRLYANKELIKISVMYSQSVQPITLSFRPGTSHKYTTADL
jgi:hypothetical protein